jgi:transposase
LVETVLAQDVRCGAVFVFVNRRRTTAKLIRWDGTGLVILHKRLAEKRFAKVWDLERRHDGRLVLRSSELATLLEGGQLLRAEAR